MGVGRPLVGAAGVPWCVCPCSGVVCLGCAFGNHFKLTEMEVNDKDLKMRMGSSFFGARGSVGATFVLELIFPFFKIFHVMF